MRLNKTIVKRPRFLFFNRYAFGAFFFAIGVGVYQFEKYRKQSLANQPPKIHFQTSEGKKLVLPLIKQADSAELTSLLSGHWNRFGHPKSKWKVADIGCGEGLMMQTFLLELLSKWPTLLDCSISISASDRDERLLAEYLSNIETVREATNAELIRVKGLDNQPMQSLNLSPPRIITRFGSIRGAS